MIMCKKGKMNLNVSMHKNKLPSSFKFTCTTFIYERLTAIQALTMSFLFAYEPFRLKVKMPFIFTGFLCKVSSMYQGLG